MTRAALLALLAGACSENVVVVKPVIDIPINDMAQATTLDTVTLSVAHAGAAVGDDIVSATFSRGDVIELPGVPFGDDLVIHMIGRVGTTEIAYGRTCQFAVRPDARLPTPHVFFSREVKFGELSTKPLPRVGGTAMMYSDGSGLALGGFSFGEENIKEPLVQVERFDPNSAEYETLHDIQRRFDSASALVGTGPDTRVVIIGGLDVTTGSGAEFVEVIDAQRNTDRQYDMFFEPRIKRLGHTATTLTDGSVIVIGGRSPEGVTACGTCGRLAQISVTSGTTAISELRAQLAKPRYGHTATRLANDVGAPVVVIGGIDDTGLPIAQAELFKPLAEDFSKEFTAQMLIPRSQHQAVRLPDGGVLVIGGVDAMGQPIKDLELFSPLDSRFLAAGELPPTAGRVGMTATVLPDGRVLLTGGRINLGDPPVNTAFIARLDPLDGTVDVVDTHRLGVGRSGHQATLLCDGTVLISGGTTGIDSYERYNPTPVGRR
jgi:hypothetical protein